MRRVASGALVLALAGGVAASAQATPPRERARASASLPAFRVNLGHRPRGVSRTRLRYLVSKSARRWRIRIVGYTRRSPNRVDRHNVIGFSSRLPLTAAGQTRLATTYVNGRPVRREWDIRLNARLRWQQGPALPTGRQIDLETVLLHELGHAVGARHTAKCADSPMYDDIGGGEWWRSKRDWYRRGCPNAPRRPRS